MQNIITCEDEAQFVRIVASLSREAIAFKANGSSLTITIIGF